MKGISPLVLVILDGWGIAPPGKGNAISLARKPFWDRISVAYPHTSLIASGEEVGLPKGEAGNSQVGHLNIGAGKIVYQELPRINMAISDGSFLKNPAFLAAAEHVKKNKSNLHLFGLVGRGSVHSSLEHLYAVLWFAKTQGLKDVFLHVFTDGRDSPPTSGLGVIKEIVAKSSQIGVGWLSSICGRYYAMDRNKRWERTSICYEALVQGVGDKVKEPIAAVRELYEKGVTDEFIKPLLTAEEGKLVHTIKDGDSVIFFNFRPDRARQLTRSLVDPTFSGFKRKSVLKNLIFVSMTEYEKNLPVLTAFPSLMIDYPLAAVLSEYEKRQLHIGETEKYAHVTYFINGGREEPYLGEVRMHIPSSKVATYDQKPQMSALEIANYVCERLADGVFDVYIVNFANPDMVAHTGSLSATVKAVETIDECLKKIGKAILSAGGVMMITGDHGNAESMINQATGGVDTEHSVNPVPLIIVSEIYQTRQNKKLPAGILADVAPTALSLLGIPVPESMTGRNLLA